MAPSAVSDDWQSATDTYALRDRANSAVRLSRLLRAASADHRTHARHLRIQLHRRRATVHAYGLTMRAAAERAVRATLKQLDGFA